jgi:hypothetical protein
VARELIRGGANVNSQRNVSPFHACNDATSGRMGIRLYIEHVTMGISKLFRYCFTKERIPILKTMFTHLLMS